MQPPVLWRPQHLFWGSEGKMEDIQGAINVCQGQLQYWLLFQLCNLSCTLEAISVNIPTETVLSYNLKGRKSSNWFIWKQTSR